MGRNEAETVYDPCCGTGGFLAEAYNHLRQKLGPDSTPRHLTTLREKTFFGREKENLVCPIALANLVLHEIDRPNLWHGNTLTGHVIYDGLFADAPAQFDVILTNPPFGGKEGDDAQTNFAYKTSSTQVLFLQHIIDHLKDGGRCGMVIDEAGTSERSWWVDRPAIEECNFDLKAVNPNRKANQDTRTPAELLDLIDAKGKEVAAAVAKLRTLIR